MRGSPIDDSGKTLRNLQVLSPVGKIGRSFPYKCRCFCGKEFVTKPEGVLQGLVQSCGCLRAAHARKIGALPSTIAKAKKAHQKYFNEKRDRAGLRNINAYGISTALRAVTLPPVLDKFLKRLYGICCLCGSDKRLIVHHIVPFSECVKSRRLHLLYDATNLSVVCKECHSKTVHLSSFHVDLQVQGTLLNEASKKAKAISKTSTYSEITESIRKNLKALNFESVLYKKRSI